MGRLLNTHEAAAALNTPLNTLRYWLARGEAPASFIIGRRRMFREEAIEAFIESKERAEQKRENA